MEKPIKSYIKFLCVIIVLTVIGYIPIWLDDVEAVKNRERLNGLIVVGDNLLQAERVLRSEGFQLVYARPIKPTINQDYLQQLVVVGSTKPNVFESFAYAAGWRWIPFSSSESPYVILNANLEGKITKID